MQIGNVVERIQPAAAKMQENLYVRSITGGMMAGLPALMVGAICSLVVGFPVSAWTEWVNGNALGTAMQIGNDATTGLYALYVTVGIGYVLGRELKQDPLATVMASLMAFMLVLPFETTVTAADETQVPVLDVIPTTWLGPQGVFTAIIAAVLATRLYAFVVSRGWRIKMPASVPPNVSRPLESIIPVAVVGILFIVIRVAFSATSYGFLGNFVFTLIGQPLANIGTSFGAFLVIVFAAQFVWLLGIHNMAVWAVVLPIVLPPMMAQQDAGAAGEPLPYMLTFTFVFAILQWVGGPGGILGLATNMVLFAKSTRYKKLGRLGIGPSVFNIIEPIQFGFPIVLNPIMAVPFVVIPLINVTLGYVLMSAGIIGVPWVALPMSVFTMPFVPGGFLLGAGVGFGIFMIVAFLITVVVWYPFFRVADRREYKLEQEAAASAASATAPAAIAVPVID